jgi:hypothetical protein
LEEFYAQRNSNIVGWRNLYFRDENTYFVGPDGKVPDKSPDEVRVIVPIAQGTVDTFIELLLTKRPVISVPRLGVSKEDTAAAEHNEKVLWATWDEAQILRQVTDSLWHGLVDGWGVLQLVWDFGAGPGESKIVVQSHDPYNVYAMPSDRPGVWEYVIHAYPVLVGGLRNRWTSGKQSLRRTRVATATLDKLEDDDMVTLIDYWDKEFNGVAVAYSVVDKERGSTEVVEWLKEPLEHGYGFLPWEIYFPSPLPFPTVGERFGTSILYPIQDLIVEYSQLVSIRGTYMRRHLDPPLITKTQEGRDFAPVRTEAGLHFRLETDESAEYLVNPGTMPQLDGQLQIVKQAIENASLPAVLQGQYVGSVSGVAMSLLRNPTLMKVGFKQGALERVLSSLNARILTLYEKYLTRPVELWGHNPDGRPMGVEIDPKKICGRYKNDVKLSASLPTDDANTVNMVVALVQVKLISRQTGLDVLQQMLHDMLPQSVTDENQRVLAESILDNPQLLQGLAQRAAEEGGLPWPLETPKGESGNPAMGEKEVTLPAQTLAAQSPGMPGGNTNPTVGQRMQELQAGAAAAGESVPQITVSGE